MLPIHHFRPDSLRQVLRCGTWILWHRLYRPHFFASISATESALDFWKMEPHPTPQLKLFQSLRARLKLQFFNVFHSLWTFGDEVAHRSPNLNPNFRKSFLNVSEKPSMVYMWQIYVSHTKKLIIKWDHGRPLRTQGFFLRSTSATEAIKQHQTTSIDINCWWFQAFDISHASRLMPHLHTKLYHLIMFFLAAFIRTSNTMIWKFSVRVVYGYICSNSTWTQKSSWTHHVLFENIHRIPRCGWKNATNRGKERQILNEMASS